MDLNFILSIGSCAKGVENLIIHMMPHCWEHNYVVDINNDRLQVMDSTGQFIYVFGQEGERTLDERAISSSHWCKVCVCVTVTIVL